MKKTFAIACLLTASVFLISCGTDDEDPSLFCLQCTSSDPNVVIDGDRLCEGDKDPDTGEEITRGDLQAAKNVFESFGATCILD